MKIKSFLKGLGIIPLDQVSPAPGAGVPYDLKESADTDKIKEHKEFLKSALEEENTRLGHIENKTSQIISQTSIVFSLVGLFVPLIIEKSETSPLAFKVSVIALLIVAFMLYLLAITNALKNFNVLRFRYPTPSPENVIAFKDKSLAEFNAELVRDYLYCIRNIVHINNSKATNLLHAYRAFKMGNYTTGIIVVYFCSALLFAKDKETEIFIKNAIEVRDLDKVRPIIIYQRDTVYKIDTIRIP